MIFWTSGEISTAALESYRVQIVNRAGQLINKNLSAPPLSSICDGWEWAFIAIIIDPTLGVDYPERVRCNNKNHVFEFRLKIDFEEFVRSSRDQQISLVFDQLHRSVDLMAKWKVSKTDRESLHEVLRNVQVELCASA